MEVGSDDWEDVVSRHAIDLLGKVGLESELMHYKRVKILGAPSAKLVYIFIRHHQPQSLASIRRTLGIGSNSVLRALRELTRLGFIVRDEEFLYWMSIEGIEKQGE